MTTEKNAFSLIIPLMRKSSIQRTVDYYASLPDETLSEIILVDFDHPYTQANGLQRPLDRVRVIEVKGHHFFNKSIALNIGCHFAKWDRLIVCDADVLIRKETLISWMSIDHNDDICKYLGVVIESETAERRKGFGICTFSKRCFHRIGGYDSRYLGWGFEDRDYLERLRLSGVTVIEDGEGIHLTHSDEERTRNYHSDDKLQMRQKNLVRYDALLEGNEMREGTLTADLNAFLKQREGR
ncbi:MAG: galactosyltransferase-related protein [Chloroflexota bacterium]